MDDLAVGEDVFVVDVVSAVESDDTGVIDGGYDSTEISSGVRRVKLVPSPPSLLLNRMITESSMEGMILLRFLRA